MNRAEAETPLYARPGQSTTRVVFRTAAVRNGMGRRPEVRGSVSAQHPFGRPGQLLSQIVIGDGLAPDLPLTH